MDSKRIVIAGGSGFIGSTLAAHFSALGFSVAVLTRTPRQRTDSVQEIEWDGVHLGAWIAHLEGAAALINLVGKSINCPHTPENLREIAESRVNSVNLLAVAVSHVKVPPRVWAQASAVGIYGDTGDVIHDENSPCGRDALAGICRQWEGAFAAAKTPHTRKVTLRIGFVLGRNGGALPILSRLTKYFLGGAAGSGRQYVSWIHAADVAAMFAAAVANEKLSGTFNAVGPEAVTNAQFMRALRRAWHRPWSPPVPAFAIKLGARLLGTEPSLALVSQRCMARRFKDTGFRFQFGDLASALNDLCSKST